MTVTYTAPDVISPPIFGHHAEQPEPYQDKKSLSEHAKPQTNHVPDMKINFFGHFHPPSWLMRMNYK